jgi:signal transduction histidine kinase
VDDLHLQISEVINASLNHLLEGDADAALAVLDAAPAVPESEGQCITLFNHFRKFILNYKSGIEFINALAEGDLDMDPPRQNYVISHYKMLQSNLRHLTWQTQQIARGDYNQKVSYLGDFSVAFNQLIESLKEKSRIEAQLKDLYKTRDQFMSIISHDLKSPFNSILGFADLLRQDYDELTDEERKRFIDNIRNSSYNAFRLLENLLEWSRIQTGKIIFLPERLNISRLISETIQLMKPAAEKKGIHLYSKVDPNAQVYADKNAVLAILRNLLNNAIKFTTTEGKVTFTNLLKEPFQEISVTDTGVGIAPDIVGRLFRLEEKIKTEGTDHESGTGLGLLLCREFTEQNHGQIGVESEPGKGSRFYFALPVSEGHLRIIITNQKPTF